MKDVKGLLQSKTVWGALLAIASIALQFFGIELVDSAAWVNDIVALFGAGFAIFGRIKATKKIG